MEDGPEQAAGSYTLDGVAYDLEERESEIWCVTAPDGRYVGDVVAEQVVGVDGPRYTVRFPDDRTPEPEFVEGWQSALEYLISESTS